MSGKSSWWLRGCAYALVALGLAGCASVEELVAEGDQAKANGNTARAYELYWNAYHKDADHPLVKARLPGAHKKPPLHESR